jgi:hypothetical protein
MSVDVQWIRLPVQTSSVVTLKSWQLVSEVWSVVTSCISNYLSIYLSVHLCSCCSHLEHGASVKCFISLQFLSQTDGRTPWMRDQPVARLLRTQDNTNRINTNVHALSGIRTHDPSVWVGEDISCLRPCGDHDRCELYKRAVNPVINPRPVYSQHTKNHGNIIISSATTCPSQHILLDLIMLIMFDEEDKSQVSYYPVFSIL